MGGNSVWTTADKYYCVYHSHLSTIGKYVAGKHYVHVSVLPLLSERDQALVRQAIDVSGLAPDRQFNVIRVSDDGNEVALLAYPGFFEEPFPALAGSWRFHAGSQGLRFRDYSQSLNPPILHRKELLLAVDHPDYQRFCELTRIVEALGLFENPTQIGYRSTWLELIQSKGYELQGYDLVPIGNYQAEKTSAEPHEEIIAIERHRTALSRTSLSAPVQSLIRHGLLTPERTLLTMGLEEEAILKG